MNTSDNTARVTVGEDREGWGGREKGSRPVVRLTESLELKETQVLVPEHCGRFKESEICIFQKKLGFAKMTKSI